MIRLTLENRKRILPPNSIDLIRHGERMLKNLAEELVNLKLYKVIFFNIKVSFSIPKSFLIKEPVFIWHISLDT